MEEFAGVRGEKVSTLGLPYKSEAATPTLVSEPLFGAVAVQTLVPAGVATMLVYVPFEYFRATKGALFQSVSLELII
jgi:hypothetical protein